MGIGNTRGLRVLLESQDSLIMRIISHRGNLYGPDKSRENLPTSIDEVLSLGWDSEIDVWNIEGKLFLGHDKPETLISFGWIQNRRNSLWVHCKNKEALNHLVSEASTNCFWHENDKFTLTSHGYIWCYPGNLTYGKSVIVLPELTKASDLRRQISKNQVFGICTDFPKKYERFLA